MNEELGRPHEGESKELCVINKENFTVFGVIEMVKNLDMIDKDQFVPLKNEYFVDKIKPMYDAIRRNKHYLAPASPMLQRTEINSSHR